MKPVGILSVNHLALGLWMRKAVEISKYYPEVGWSEKDRSFIWIFWEDKNVYMNSVCVFVGLLGYTLNRCSEEGIEKSLKF